tara:strand:- start:6145 stop:6711 length:567 start_codon:yes stop_codon:yes gene_type:complete
MNNKSYQSNYGLTEVQVKEFISLFPVSKNGELAIKFTLSINQIAKLRNKFNLVKQKHRASLKPAKLKQFIHHYPNLKNKDLADKFSLTIRQVEYLAKTKGLEKNPSPIELSTRTKFCKGCDSTKLVKFFSRKSNAKDGCQTWCKDCCAKRKRLRDKPDTDLKYKPTASIEPPEWWKQGNKELLAQQSY